jgi:hypothetical protein
VVLAVLYVLLVRSAVFSQPTQRATIGSGAGRAEDGLAAEATVLSIDPVTNTFQVRLEIDPVGTYRMRPRTPSRQLEVLVNAINGEQRRVYRPGQPVETADVTVDAVGDAVLYPFDRHTALLQIEAFDEAGAAVPIRATVTSDLHDWRIRAGRSAGDTDDDTSIDITATRSTSVVSLAIALMVLVAMLVLVTMAVVVRSVRHPSRPDFAIVASLVALLFAIPALRSSLPEAPPPGTVTDFIVFLWALVVVGVLMVVLSLVYIRRYGRH